MGTNVVPLSKILRNSKIADRKKKSVHNPESLSKNLKKSLSTKSDLIFFRHLGLFAHFGSLTLSFPGIFD